MNRTLGGGKHRIRLLVSVLACLSQVAWGAASREEFLSAVPSLMPANLSPIVVELEAQGRSAGRTVAGYDAKSGAWFVARQGGCVGRAPDGSRFRAEIADSGPLRRESVFAELIAVAEYIPWAYLGAFAEQPDAVLHAEKGGDGVWEVTFQAIHPSIQHGRPDLMVRIDASSGRVLSIESVAENPRRSDFVWDDSGLGFIPQDGRQLPLKRVGLNLAASMQQFSPQAVFALMKESRVLVDQKLLAVESGYVERPDGTWSRPDQTSHSVQPFQDPWTRKFRTPLILGGTLIIGMVVFQIVRRRSA